MEEITIHYRTKDSETHEESFGLDSTSVYLYDRGIIEIDLTPISMLTELEDIDLSKNALRQIDISPLRYCQKLERLCLSENELEAIDLTPLIELPKLTFLLLQNNNLAVLNPTFLLDIPYLYLEFDEDTRIEFDEDILLLDPDDYSFDMSETIRDLLRDYKAKHGL